MFTPLNYNPSNLQDVLKKEDMAEGHHHENPVSDDNFTMAPDDDHPSGQVVTLRGAEKVVIENYQYVPVTLTLGQNSTYAIGPAQEITFQLQQGQGYGLVKDILAQMKFVTSGPVQLLALPFLFTSIEFWSGSGKNKLQTLYPEQMMEYFANTTEVGQKKKMAHQFNFNVENYQDEYIQGSSGGSVETVTYTWPLFGNWLTVTNGVYFPTLAVDEILWVKFFLRANPVKSGAPANITMTNFQLLLYEQKLAPDDEMLVSDLWRKNVFRKDYLDNIIWQPVASTFTAATQYLQQMVAFIGKASYITFDLKSTASTGTEFYYDTAAQAGTQGALTQANTQITNNVFRRTQYLGKYQDGLLFDIRNATNQRINSDQAVQLDLLRFYDKSKWIPGDYASVTNQVIYQFGDMIAAEVGTVRKGYFPLTSNEYFALTPAPTNAETAEVWTIQVQDNNSGTPTAINAISGSWAFTLMGMQSPPIAYNASLVTINGLVYNLLSKTLGIDGTPVRCVVSGSLLSASASAGLAFTFSNLPLDYGVGRLAATFEGLKLTASNINMIGTGNVSTFINTVFTTPGVCLRGFVTGTYQLTARAAVFRHFHMEGGRVVNISLPQPFSN